MPRAQYRTKKKKLPSLEDRYRCRSEHRSTASGIAMEALAGDKEMIAKLAGAGESLMHDAWQSLTDSSSDYAFWLAGILGKIAQGESPNEAFGWHGKGHEEKLHGGESWQHVSAAYEVGSTVEYLIQNIAGKSRDHAIQHVAALYRISESECNTKLTSMPLQLNNLNKAAARELALEAVATFGASGHRVAHSTADSHHREFLKSRGNK